MAGYIGKMNLNKKSVETLLLISGDEHYDDYYALKINDNLFHVYGVKGPRLITRINNYDLNRLVKED